MPNFVNNFPSYEWAKTFSDRHKEKPSLRQCQNIKASRTKLSAEDVSEYFERMKETLTKPDRSEIPPSNLFNFDETNLSDNPGTKKCLFKRGVKYPERVKDSTKASISMMFCGSANGCMLPAYVVYKTEHIWSIWTEGEPIGVRYSRSKSGWFDGPTFEDWFNTIFLSHVRNIPGKKVLLGDNLSTHFSPNVLKAAAENNIVMACLVPNATHIMQPLDVAFFAPMKRVWRNILNNWKAAPARGSSTISKDHFPRLLKQLCVAIYGDDSGEDILMRQSARLVSGFRKCGLVPFNPEEVLSRLPDYQPPDVGSNVSTAVVNVLKEMRGVDKPRNPPQKRRRIAVLPGASISVEGSQDHLNQQAPSTSSSASGFTSDRPCSSTPMPRSTRARRHQARIPSDNSSDSESSKDIDYGSSSDSQYDDELLLSSDENQATDLPSDTFTIDGFMLVQFEGTLCYVAKIVEEVEEGEDLIVSYLRKNPNIASAFWVLTYYREDL